MKLKNLRKKIRRLEARLQEGPKKLAKLKRKLDTIAAAKARKAQRKAATRAVPRQTAKHSRPTAKGPSVAKKTKRKLNLSPERRAQLAFAMKARWAAKRAAAQANPQSASTA
jgi:predicted  nucleic acid-binding Zn-ribbon protein